MYNPCTWQRVYNQKAVDVQRWNSTNMTDETKTVLDLLHDHKSTPNSNSLTKKPRSKSSQASTAGDESTEAFRCATSIWHKKPAQDSQTKPGRGFLNSGVLGHTNNAENLLLAMLRLPSDGIWRTYGKLRMEPGLVMCMANPLQAVLFLQETNKKRYFYVV